MEWEPIQGREAFLGRPEGGSKPSIEGRDTLAWAMAELVPKAKPPKKRRWWWPKWMTWKRAVALVVLDIILGNIAWHYLFASHPGDVAKALQSTMSDVSHNHWDDVYNSLCRSDRAQIRESELAGAGRAAMASIGFLDHATVTSVTPITQSLGPIDVASAAQVSGEFVPVVGQPSAYKVVLVHEIPGGWHVCLSAGGFSSEALGYDVPIGQSLTQ